MLPPTLEDRAFISYFDAGAGISAVYITAAPGAPSFNMAGTLSNNNAPPSNNNIGALPAIASAAAQVYINGNQVLLSTDLAGNLRSSIITALPAGGNVIGHVITDAGSTTSATQGTSPWVDNITQIGGSAITLGQKVSASSLPVVIASDQSAIPVSQSGVWTVQPGNTANTTPWLTTINQGGNSATVTGANALKVDGSAVTQPVSGTVTAIQGTSPWVDNLTQVGGSAITLGQKVSASSLPVVLASDQSAIPVSQSGTWTVQPGNTANTTPWLATINQGGNSATVTAANALKVDGSAVTQPVSGTVTATQGTSPWVDNITQIGGSAISLGQKTMAASLPVVIASDQTAIPVSQSGTWTVQPGNTANTTPWLTTINQGGNSATVTGANALKVDGSAVTQPVSGTVTATQGTSPWVDNLTQVGGSAISLGQKTSANSFPVVIASDQSAVTVAQATAANLNATVIGVASDNSANSTSKFPVIPAVATTAAPSYTNNNQVPLSVDLAGNLRVTSSGTIGTVNQGSANTIANAWPFKITDGTNTAAVTAASALQVDGSGVTQPISGTITANAGTGNFNVVGTLTNNNAAPAGNNLGVLPALANTAAPTYTDGRQVLLSVDTSGNLRVTSSGTIGTVTQGNQGTIGQSWYVALTDLTNVIGTAAHPVRIDPTGTTTQPVSGTVTANIGTTNGLALDATVSGLQVAQGSTTSGQKGGLIMGAVTTAAPSYTTAQTSPLSLTTAGALRIDGSGVTQPISGTITANAGTGTFQTNMAQISGTAASVNNGTADAGTLRVTVASNSTGTIAATQSGTWTVQPGNTANTTPWLFTINQGGNSATVTGANALKVDGSAVTQPVSGTVTANAGTGNFNNAAIGATAATAPTSASESGFIAATTALPTAVTSGQLVGAMSDPFGREIVIPQAPRGLVTPATLTVTDNASHNLFAAGAANVFRDISSLIITNSSATAVTVTLSDGTNSYLFDIAANGGMVSNWQVPLPATSSATAWTVQSSASVSSLHFTSIAINNK